MNEKDRFEILKFVEAFVAFQATRRERLPSCDISLYAKHICCFYHEMKEAEYQALLEMGSIIDRRYPSIRNGNHVMKICSVGWFTELQTVSGLSFSSYLTTVFR